MPSINSLPPSAHIDHLRAELEKPWEHRVDIDFEAAAKTFMVSTAEGVEAQLLLLALEADVIAANFHQTSLTARKEMPKEQQTYLGCRVRIKDSSLEISWHRNSVIPKEKSKSSIRVLSKHIKKGKSDCYDLSLFQREPAWVQAVVADAEKTFAKLRTRAKILTKFRKALREYESLSS